MTRRGAIAVLLSMVLWLPAAALLDSGVNQTVFVERGEGVFESRPVETGWRHEDRVEIVQGLAAGERIALSGTFLLDSESRMKLAAAGATGHMHQASIPMSMPADDPHSGHTDGSHAHSGHQP
jgi:hypothetical protein